MFCRKWEWYQLERLNSVPHGSLEIQTTPSQGHLVLASALQPVVVVTMPVVAATFISIIPKMTYGTNFKLLNILDVEIANLINKDLNTSIDKPENQWNIHLVCYETCTSIVKPSCTINSYTVHGVLGILTSPISTRWKTAWIGESRWILRLDWSFMSQLCCNSTHFVIGVVRQCSCDDRHLKIQTIILQWKSIVPKHSILRWQVCCSISTTHVCHWGPQGVFQSCQTRIPGCSNPRVDWADAVAFRCSWERWQQLCKDIRRLVTTRGASGSADDKPGCAGNMPGSTSKYRGQAWERQDHLWEWCRCAWKS